jgi:hypothetical protein
MIESRDGDGQLIVEQTLSTTRYNNFKKYMCSINVNVQFSSAVI